MRSHLQGSRAMVSHLRHEHYELDRLALDAESMLRSQGKRNSSEGTPAWVEKLTALRDQLRRHSEQEFSGGCLEEAVCGHPELVRSATLLEHEYRCLIADLSELIELAEENRVDAAVAQRRLADLADRMRYQQVEEKRLLGEACGLEVIDGRIFE